VTTRKPHIITNPASGMALKEEVTIPSGRNKPTDDPSPRSFYIYKDLPGHTVRANLGGRDITSGHASARGVMSTKNIYRT